MPPRLVDRSATFPCATSWGRAIAIPVYGGAAVVLCITGSLGGGSIGQGRRTVPEALALARQMVAEGYREVRVVDLDTREVVFLQEEAKAAQL